MVVSGVVNLKLPDAISSSFIADLGHSLEVMEFISRYPRGAVGLRKKTLTIVSKHYQIAKSH